MHMKKWINRCLAGILAFLMAVSLLPAPVLAAEAGQVEIEAEAPTYDAQQAAETPADDVRQAAETPADDAQQPAEAAVPTSITIACDPARQIDGKLVGKKGDQFLFRAYDQDGRETPVTWSTSSTWAIAMDGETGIATVTSETSPGSSSYLQIRAVSKADTNVSSEGRFELTGYQISSYGRSATLDSKGQSVTTISLSGGFGGHSIWSYDEAAAAGVARLVNDPGKGTSIRFQALRPGSFSVTVSLDTDPAMTDTATVTVSGVAVEDPDGVSGKTYLELGAGSPAPMAQLAAYCASDRSIQSWSSSNEDVASVDENGLVTARGVGSALITATDSAGSTGGIQMVVQSADEPYFEALEFMTTAFMSGTWVKGETFSPTTLSYDLPIRTYSTGTLTLQATTLYQTDQYTAVAEYTDLYGKKQSVPVNSGASTKLPDQPFGDSVLTITLTDRADAGKSTVYTFHVNRPRDTGKTLKNTGIVLTPEGRGLLSTRYQGQPEGTFFRADENGNVQTVTGVTGSHYNYRTYALENLEHFSLTLTGNTAYQHLRYAADGAGWRELPEGGGRTERLSFGESKTVRVQIQVLDDKTYMENKAAGREGFDGGEPNTYTVWVEQTGADARSAQILTATTESGDWYPAFDPAGYSYNVIVPSDQSALTLSYTVTEGASVKLGQTAQLPGTDGTYTLALRTSNQTLEITSADGQVTNNYVFRFQKKSALGVPDRVTDYLVINSQYTNGGAGVGPEATLAANMKSLGNFGGYITYYYEEPLTDDPGNRYGVDFYVYGNANVDTSTSTGTSFFEPGQVWVSENGQDWYALAGSAHYEEEVDWNYTVNYRRASNGKTAWSDNRGNSSDGSKNAGPWPLAANYYMNGLAGQEEITLSGILLPAADGTVTGNGSSDAYPVNWGYADTFSNGKLGEEVNPYLPNEDHKHRANGFDLAWAVDTDGIPVDVSGMEFHYVKVVTASNIWHSAFGDKSTEVTAVIRNIPQSGAVGVTAAPKGVTFTDGASTVTVNLKEGQQVYDVDLGDMRYASIFINGADPEDHLYVNNQRIQPDGQISGLKLPVEGQEKLLRLLVQNGEREPLIYLLRLHGSADSSKALVEEIKLNVNGTVRKAQTTDGIQYTATVGYAMDSVKIVPVAAPDVAVSINGADPAGSYELLEGENRFRVTASKGDTTEEITLMITREAAPAGTGKMTVYLTLLGDEAHGAPAGEEETHTFHKNNLTPWIWRQAYSLEAPATVLDVLKEAVKDNGISFENDGGNYIAALGGLAAFENGAYSGWMYLLNGTYPAYGVLEQQVQEGDEIIFHYTDDYRAEDQTPAMDVFRVEQMIQALPPAEELTKEDRAAVLAARDAFGALPETEQERVSGEAREKLAAAVLKIAELLKAEAESIDGAYRAAADYLEKQTGQSSIQVGSTGGEWLAIGFARSGRLDEKQAADYYANVVSFVERSVNDKGQLHRAKSTENSRLILGLTAIGKDVANVAGHNLLAGLTDMGYVKKQGINGPIWALIALDSHGYELPSGGDVTRAGLTTEILNAQLADGGWALAGTAADPDMTAMALLALAPYREDIQVEKAVESGLACLSRLQKTDGGYVSAGASNSESCAQVIAALTALGIDPAADGRFVKNGNSVMDALLSFQSADGGFSHTADGMVSGMATEQCYIALAAYSRFLEGEAGLYDMGDVTIVKSPGQPSDPGNPGQPEKPSDPGNPGQPEKPSDPENAAGADNSGNGQNTGSGTSQTGARKPAGTTKTLEAGPVGTGTANPDPAESPVELAEEPEELMEDQTPLAAGGEAGAAQESGAEGQSTEAADAAAAGMTGAGVWYIWAIVAAAAAVVLVAAFVLKRRQQAGK